MTLQSRTNNSVYIYEKGKLPIGVRKNVLRHELTEKSQTSLRINAFCSNLFCSVDHKNLHLYKAKAENKLA